MTHPTPDHHAVVSLPTLAGELLDQARAHASGRAARTVASSTSLRGTVIALTEGTRLADHDAPAAATLQVLAGRVRLHTDDREWLLDSSALLPIPPQRHGLDALADSVVLLTVALR
jgi:quercetin dioxygenase-like cupin family protein